MPSPSGTEDLDPELVERVFALSGASTRHAAVTTALRELVARREQELLLTLLGKLEWDDEVDYKRELSRDSLYCFGGCWRLMIPNCGEDVQARERLLAPTTRLREHCARRRSSLASAR
jgi:Arc/MetJ family transcription regulator